nr:transposase [Thiomonas sp.]
MQGRLFCRWSAALHLPVRRAPWHSARFNTGCTSAGKQEVGTLPIDPAHCQARTREVESLFDRLNQALADLGVELKSGQIIDATFVPVPIQRNGREDNALIKQDAVPIEWGKTPAKLAQKDIDARWTKKGGQNHDGYKNHINIDRATKLIAAHACTPAHVHDSQVLGTVLRPESEGGKDVWADSAYRSDEQEC